MAAKRISPKVSVIVPIYGVEKYIERCARSLFEQTLSDIEFIFIDDCTQDNSMKILSAIIDIYRPRFAGMGWTVRTERMLTNSGLAAVRKYGIQLAKGEFLIHCDSDDWVDKSFCEKLYNRAIEDKADIVMCDYFTDDGYGTRKYVSAAKGVKNKQDFFRNVLLQRIGASVWNKLIRRELILPENLLYARANMGEDYVLTIQYAYYAKHIAEINEPLYYYFNNTDSITKSMSEEKIYYRFLQSVKNMEVVLEFMGREGLCREYESELDRMKLYKRNNLLPIISKRKYYEQWRNTFPEINRRILRNKYLTLRERIKYALIYLRIKRNWT